MPRLKARRCAANTITSSASGVSSVSSVIAAGRYACAATPIIAAHAAIHGSDGR